MLRYLSAGESHGRELTAIVEGMPSGLRLLRAHIDVDLKRRQSGYGRGQRMKIESDKVEITSGVRSGATTGAPIALIVKNRDWENWLAIMDVETPGAKERALTRPRPGHADLTGALKYSLSDLRDVLERSSARETTVRVAVGAVAKRLLDAFGISVYSWVVNIGGVEWTSKATDDPLGLYRKADGSEVRCPDANASKRMTRRIDEAKSAGDSLGGAFEVVATGVPPGLGSHVQYDRKLDGLLSRALMSVQAIKGVEFGVGFRAASLPGSKVHDEIFHIKRAKSDKNGFWPRAPRFYRKTNNAGGIEGGMSNGEPIVARAVMKPIPTLYRPLRSVDIFTKKPFEAGIERSDVCAVPAAAVVAEAAIAFELAVQFLIKFGGDSMREVERNYRTYLAQIGEF